MGARDERSGCQTTGMGESGFSKRVGRQLRRIRLYLRHIGVDCLSVHIVKASGLGMGRMEQTSKN